MVSGKDISLLVMYAKYDGDDANRKLAGEELISACLAAKDVGTLRRILLEEDFHPRTREEAKGPIVEAASALCEAEGSSRALLALATDREMPNPVLQFAGMKLFERLCLSMDRDGLLELSSNQSAHEEPRKAAGFRLVHGYEAENAYSLLYSLTVHEGLPYEVRKTAGARLAELSVREGNYPLLLRMGQDTRVPLNLRIELDEKAEKAASRAISDAASGEDHGLLSFIAGDERLSERHRAEAKSRLIALERAEGKLVPDKDKEGALLARTRERISTNPPVIRPRKTH